MTHTIVTERSTDADLIREHLIAMDWHDVKVVARGTRMRAISYAKTISINEEFPAAVVFDAETSDEDRLQMMRSEFQDLVSPLPTEIAPILILAEPTIEAAIDQLITEDLDAFLNDQELDGYRYAPRP